MIRAAGRESDGASERWWPEPAAWAFLLRVRRLHDRRFNKTVTAGNPMLDPYRAKAYDLSFEWYFAEDSLVSLALFQKDIDSFVQIVRSTDNFATTRSACRTASRSLLAARSSRPTATCLLDWQFSVPTNTDGGDLKGFEISYQQPFSFLPGFFSHFGMILNYTGVESEIEYLLLDRCGRGQRGSRRACRSRLTTRRCTGKTKRFSARVSASLPRRVPDNGSGSSTATTWKARPRP